jgi:hypothetical protein
MTMSDPIREALEPFAKIADWYDDSEDDHFIVLDDYPHGWRANRDLMQLKNFRRAREALSLLPTKASEDQYAAAEVDEVLASLDQAIEEGAGDLAMATRRIIQLMREEHRRLADGLTDATVKLLELPPKASDDELLPCDVKLPPATVIRAGCSYSTLREAIEHRREAGVVHFKDGAATAGREGPFTSGPCALWEDNDPDGAAVFGTDGQPYCLVDGATVVGGDPLPRAAHIARVLNDARAAISSMPTIADEGERARIVVFLDAEAAEVFEGGPFGKVAHAMISQAARRIERGEHLQSSASASVGEG